MILGGLGASAADLAEKFEKVDKNNDLGLFGPGKSFLGRFGARGKKNRPKICLGGDFLGQNKIFNVWQFSAVRNSHFPNSPFAVAD